MRVRQALKTAALGTAFTFAGLSAATATAAPAAISVGGDARVAVQDTYGYLLPQSAVSFRVDGGPLVKAVHNGDGTVTLPAAGNKFSVTVEHPYYGAHTAELTLPDNVNGVVRIQMDTTGVEAKFVPSSQIDTVLTGGQSFGVTCATGVGCQFPDQLGHGGGGTVGATSDNNPGAGFQVADTFEAAASGSVSDLCWWGIYVDFGLLVDCGPGTGDSFSVTYYNDDGSGTTPGSVLAGPLALSTTSFATGNTIATGIGPIAEYQYEASHAPVAVTSGTCYWIEITNSTTATCFWLWSTAPGGDNRGAQAVGGVYAPTDYDQAFCVDVATNATGCGGPPPAGNDECSGAEVISGQGTFGFDNSTATSSGPIHPVGVCDKFGQPDFDSDVWFAWTSDFTGTARMSTCGNTVDTKIAAYDTCTCPVDAGASTLLDCNDDFCGFQSQIEFPVVSGNCYLLRVGTFPGAGGGVGTFTIDTPVVVTNDDCDDAIAVAVPSTTSGTTVDASTDTGVPSCGSATVTSPGVWYSFVGTGNDVTASLCNGTATFDSKISVFCGDCSDLGGLLCLDGNDDFCGLQSEVTVCTQAGATYLVLVHGFGGATGAFDLVLSDSGSSCSATVFCLTAGACCFSDGSCSILTSGDCATAGGSYQGDNTDCGQVVYTAQTCTKNWEEISTVGTALNLGDDDFADVPLGFTFNFFGVDYTSVKVGSNGYMTFGPDGTDFSNDVIPDTFDPNLLIAPLWDDFNPSAGGQVYAATTGPSVGNRAFIAQWQDVPQFGGSDANTFEGILFENQNVISFRYLQVTPEATTDDYTIGLENEDGTDGVSFSGDQAVAGACFEFLPDVLNSPCALPLQVDIVPESCPNPFNAVSRGAVWVSIAGSASFDVNDIDVHTVYLTRADGVGAGVSPFEGPPGPFTVYEDSVTPFYGASSNCHELGPDGYTDVSMRFHNQRIQEFLQLDTFTPGEQVEVRLSGFTTSGAWFEGLDTITIAAPPLTQNLDIVSNFPDAWVQVTPSDDVADDHGWTPFNRAFAYGENVTLTADTSWIFDGDYAVNFKAWRVNGQLVSQGDEVLNLVMDDNYRVEAVYRVNRNKWTGGTILR